MKPVCLTVFTFVFLLICPLSTDVSSKDDFSRKSVCDLTVEKSSVWSLDLHHVLKHLVSMWVSKEEVFVELP